MKKPLLLALLSTVLYLPSEPPPRERALINDNRAPAGRLASGVLTLDLEARVATWYPETDSGPSVDVQAFGEVGKRPQIPGPLIRVPAGTTVQLSMRNAISNSMLVVHGLSRDSMRVTSGETQRARFKLDVPGTYYYWGTTSGRRLGNRMHEDAQLTGAIVVDSSPRVQPSTPPRDRILVIGLMADTMGGEDVLSREHLLFVINGRTWPHTERLVYAMGDTIRWRVLNTTVDPHPMHLHGAYYRVEATGNGTRDSTFAVDDRPFVNNGYLPPGRTMTLFWTPEHPGNWLFHCHIPEHFSFRGPLGALPSHDASRAHGATNHALQRMSGLVMGVTVRPRNGAASARDDDSRRRQLRLLVRTKPGSTPATPYYGFSIHERGAEPAVDSGPRTGPPIILVRGQPVGITVVNRTEEPTSIHWHGIELESYFDGVAGFSGIEQRLTPVVAQRDSFEARFTPPRAGTFMYHTHVDEERQQRAGLAGMLVVLEPGQKFDPSSDFPVLLSSPSDSVSELTRVLINGSLTPPPLSLRTGVSYRMRFANITTRRSGIQLALSRDGTVTTWTQIAKDGADVPRERRVPTAARVGLTIGDTRDVEFTPTERGEMRLDVLTASSKLLGAIVIHVR